MRLKDKVALITGGGTGIGEAIAFKFAREGASVMVAARSATVDDTARRIGERAARRAPSRAISRKRERPRPV